MTTTRTPVSRDPGRTAGAVAAMYAGLSLTVGATVAPYVDRATGHVLADHIRHGYPAYGPGDVDSAVTTWLAVLTAVGVLGAAGWAASIWAVKAHKRWAPAVATVLFLVGTGVALTALVAEDTSGEVGLAPLLGRISMLPSLAGLPAVVLLWRSRRRSERGVGS